MAGIVCCFSLIICLFGGMPPGWASVNAALAAVGGLVAWWIYHWVSKRNDGLAIIMGCCAAPLMYSLRRPGQPFLPPSYGIVITGCQCAIWMLSAPMMGVSVRRRLGTHQPPGEPRNASSDPRIRER
jgi:hypothetical protein